MLQHIHTRHLWLQDEVKKGRLMIKRVKPEEKPADLMTKILKKWKQHDVVAQDCRVILM